MNGADGTDRRLILLDAADNVLAVARPLPAGETIWIDGQEVVLDRAAGVGFKVARRAIGEGETVLKYGAPIGVARTAIAAGHLVHVHNVASSYLPSTTAVGETPDEEVDR